MKPSEACETSPNGLAATLAPLLEEIRQGLRHLHRTGESSVIDLLSADFGPGEVEGLIETLGVGEVDASIRTDGISRVYETRYRGVWVVEHRAGEGERLALQIEITSVPDLLQTQPEDLEEAALELAGLLGETGDGLGEDSASALPDGLPAIGFAAYSGTGKTTLLKQLIPILCERGLRVGLVKHAHHDFDLDIPGKDSYELRKAGARRVVVTSALRWAMVHERQERGEPLLSEALQQFDPREFDLVLVEGFKQVSFPKIELYRSSTGKEPIYPQDPDVIAVATDGPLPQQTSLPLLDLNAPHALVDFLAEWLAGQGG
jgi:molybdopterin-guanine dinucleotide biosynthesis protein MobB